MEHKLSTNWWEADQLVIYTTQSRSLTRDYREHSHAKSGRWGIWNRYLQIQCPKPVAHAASSDYDYATWSVCCPTATYEMWGIHKLTIQSKKN